MLYLTIDKRVSNDVSQLFLLKNEKDNVVGSIFAKNPTEALTYFSKVNTEDIEIDLER